MAARESLRKQPVLVVDLQSTGATPAHGHVIELAWARTCAEHDHAEVASHLVALPDGAHIPRAVSRITGLSRAHLAGAAAPARAWDALQQSAARTAAVTGTSAAPTVIHYARFETAFLRDLHQRFAPEHPFALDIVCTHAVARRLHPDLPRRGLRALAGYYGFPVELLRRSEGHVAATVFTWHHLVAALAERGVERWDELRRWLATPDAPAPAGKRAGRRRRFPMPRDKRLALPDAPGVYRMLRTSGDVLYIGKATSLKRRVNSYFTKRSGRDERLLEMLSQARDLDVTETATTVEAALLEAAEIKRRAPPYNVHLQTGARQVWFAAPDLGEAQPEPSPAHPIGPLPSRFWLAAMAALCRAVDSGERDEALLARAVGTRRDFGPEREVFEQGWALFRTRHRLAQQPGRRARQRLAAVSKVLVRLARAGQLDDGASSGDERDEQEPGWDPERIARHLERIVWHTGQLARRARWLCLLCDATVAWREPGQPRRLLVIRAGHIVERSFPGDEPPPPPPAQRPHRQRQLCFDIATYDRLRILSTELRRVVTQGGSAAVRLSERPPLQGDALLRVLDAT